MNTNKTLLTHLPSFSDDGIRLHAPRSWDELTQEQLRYVFQLMVLHDGDRDAVKTYMLFRFCGFSKIAQRTRITENGPVCLWECRFVKLKGVFYISSWQVQALIGQLAYVDNPEECSVRLDDIAGLRAVDKLLHGVSFFNYLECEKYYQMAIATQEPRWADALARRLYRTEDGEMAQTLVLDDGERLGTLMWFGHVKSVMALHFKHFFRKVEGTGDKTLTGSAFLEAMNAQVRALTDGDVTKEQQVFDTDCWRALTELDQKAREAEEYRKLKNKK